jgi:type III secretion protein U
MSGEKTEDPTPKKLRDLRKKGQVAFSKEVPSAALTIAFFVLFMALLPSLIDQSEAMILLAPQMITTDFTEAADQLFAAYTRDMMSLLAPFFLVVFAVGIGACMMQFGVLFSGEAVKPSLNKLNPATYFKNTFGVKNLVEFLKSVVKVTVLIIVVYYLVKDGIRAMVTGMSCGVPCLRGVMGQLLLDLAIWTSVPFILVAVADFAFQKIQFTKQNRMSKDEVKREYKESEGDPMIKGMRKQLHQQLLSEGQVDKARSATVLVTNPTHVAVAIVYEEGQTPLPVVTAVGTDLLAQRMMKAAEEAGVPIMRNVPLARGLLEDGIVDHYVPSELIEPMAEVLRAIRDLQGNA